MKDEELFERCLLVMGADLVINSNRYNKSQMIQKEQTIRMMQGYLKLWKELKQE